MPACLPACATHLPTRQPSLAQRGKPGFPLPQPCAGDWEEFPPPAGPGEARALPGAGSGRSVDQQPSPSCGGPEAPF